VTKKEDYFILVGSGECALTRLNDTELVCRPPSREPAPRAQEDKLYIRVTNVHCNIKLHISLTTIQGSKGIGLAFLQYAFYCLS
jgi:hypothetical protein